MLDDLELRLQLCPKIIIEHINLTPFSVRNVCLAPKILIVSVSAALKNYGQPEGTANYCQMFDNFLIS